MALNVCQMQHDIYIWQSVIRSIYICYKFSIIFNSKAASLVNRVKITWTFYVCWKWRELRSVGSGSPRSGMWIKGRQRVIGFGGERRRAAAHGARDSIAIIASVPYSRQHNALIGRNYGRSGGRRRQVETPCPRKYSLTTPAPRKIIFLNADSRQKKTTWKCSRTYQRKNLRPS